MLIGSVSCSFSVPLTPCPCASQGATEKRTRDPPCRKTHSTLTHKKKSDFFVHITVACKDTRNKKKIQVLSPIQKTLASLSQWEIIILLTSSWDNILLNKKIVGYPVSALFMHTLFFFFLAKCQWPILHAYPPAYIGLAIKIRWVILIRRVHIGQFFFFRFLLMTFWRKYTF